MAKIKLGMTTFDAIFTVSEGNAGALKVLTDSLQKSPEIDPENVFQELGFIINLDAFEIYGSNIWILYKDICRENLSKTIAMVRAIQLGVISRDNLFDALNGLHFFDMQEVLDGVKQRLPSLMVDDENPKWDNKPKKGIPAWMQRPESDYSSLFQNN